MKFSDSWFEDEVRYGFYIPSIMKRNWAAQIEVLERVAAFCDKHQIRWFMTAGTLLGAVRHHGFIPWDDDIDICMLREDFNRFLDITKVELPENLQLSDPVEQFNCFFNMKVTNQEDELFTPERLSRYHGFPFTAYMDIFVQDFVDPDDERENYREMLTKLVQQTLMMVKDGYELSPNSSLRNALSSIEKGIKELFGKEIELCAPWKESLFSVFEHLRTYTFFLEEKKYQTLNLAHYVSGSGKKHVFTSFDETVMLPFEGIPFPAPCGYDQYLHEEYGDYMKFSYAGNAHRYPYYQLAEKQLESLDVGLPFSFSFSEKYLANDERKELRPSVRVDQYLSTMEEMHGVLSQALKSGDDGIALQMLEICQKVAVDFGTMLENFAGDDSLSEAVKLLEDYCESIYQLYRTVSHSNAEQ